MILYDKIDSIMFAPCGINCKVCYKHLKPKKFCKGCLCDDEGKPEHCRKCAIKDCVKEKKLQYCFECEDFPCKKIKNLEKSYNKRYGVSLIQNSTTVKKEGVDYLMTLEAERWTCEKCGGLVSLHDTVCSECHFQINSTKKL